MVGLESTGQYGDIFISSLIKHNYGAALTNPLINDAKRKSKISKAKNDKKDTKLTVK
ncbi:IS110 family transposase [Thomasclavelia ramosa]|uniref:IS110 family transposase n=1 Tax=Thomasclavelia ramosa TaxID=1547 RepID=UPI003AFB2903